MLPASILRRVQKPARYTGGEWRAVKKDLARSSVTFALAYPDVYEVGMSHLGLRILYHCLNSRPDTACERVFLPWHDLAAILRSESLRLSSLESGLPLDEFDFVGITLQDELNYSNALALLDLGGIPLAAAERGDEMPFVIGGGPCTYNPEPLAEFFDAFVVGEGEEVVEEIVEAFLEWRGPERDHRPVGGRPDFLRRLAQIRGVYVPSLYAAEPEGSDGLLIPHAQDGAPVEVVKRFVADLDAASFPLEPIVPFCEIVHDRIQLEVNRGCTRGCRFCQAGAIYRPRRDKSLATLQQQARRLVADSGYDEISLVSLHAVDHPQITELADWLDQEFGRQRVSVALPSLRTDTFSLELAERLQRVRKTGLTFAPEAATPRLRAAINKTVTDEDLLSCVSAAFVSGWRTIKLYFMIGLPTEQEEDVLAIGALLHRAVGAARRASGKSRGRPRLNVSVSSFIPKPQSPFQWARQDSLEELRAKQALLRKTHLPRAVRLSMHDARQSILEGVLARGDRSLGPVIRTAYESGCLFDAWTDEFKFELWERAFAAHGMDLVQTAQREWRAEDPTPWDHISSGVAKRFYREEARRAERGLTTEDCSQGACSGCGLGTLAAVCRGREQRRQ